MDPKVDRGARISRTETFYETGLWKVFFFTFLESGHTNRVPTDLLYVEMGGGGFLRCAMKATLIDVKAIVENFVQIKAHLKTFQFSVCHHI